MSVCTKIIVSPRNGAEALDFYDLWERFRQGAKQYGAYSHLNLLDRKVVVSAFNVEFSAHAMSGYYSLLVPNPKLEKMVNRNIFIYFGKNTPRDGIATDRDGKTFELSLFCEEVAQGLFLELATMYVPKYNVWYQKNDALEDALQLDQEILDQLIKQHNEG